jgi:hypothetical protein
VNPTSEPWARTIDAVAKIITAIAVICGVAFASYQYFSNREYQLTTARIEAQKPFLDKRLQMYIDATTAAAIIATSKNEPEVKKAKEEFWKLYLGPMIVVQDPTVENPMRRFADCLQDSKNCDAPIAELARSLAQSCNRSLTRDWVPNPVKSITAVAQ